MNEILKCIEERRSVKAYTPEMPKKEDIDTVIKAGLEAASGRNRQCAIIVAITDKATRDRLSSANAAVLGMENDPFYGAPAILVVLAKKDVNTRVYDGSLCLGNMMLAAHSHRNREPVAAVAQNAVPYAFDMYIKPYVKLSEREV